MIIRKATLNDINGLLQLYLKLVESDERLRKELGLSKRIRRPIEKILRKNLKSQNHITLIAVEENKPIAMLFGKVYPHGILDSDKTGFISNLYVIEKFRERGIAKKLLLKELEWFKSKKVKKACFETLSNNEITISLCQKLGFKKAALKMFKELV